MLRVVVLTHFTTPQAGEVVQRLLDEAYGPEQILVVHNPTEPGLEPPPAPEGVEVVQASKNLGYARGMNLGMRRALDAGADLVLLLTHDAEWEPGAVRRIEAAARAQTQYAVLGPELEDTARGTMFSYGVRMSSLGATKHMTAPPEAVDGIYPCQSIDGAFTLLRADMLKRVGLYDEKLFGYAEESELHLRARRAGWRVGVVAGARGGQDVGGLTRPGPYAYLMTRNSLNLARLAAGWPGVVFGVGRFTFYAAVYARRLVDPRRSAESKAHARAYVAGVLRGFADFFRGRWGPPPPTLPGMGDMRGLLSAAGPSIAVVVVAHNSAADLPRTLGALREQLREGDEVVVVDNASADQSAAIARDGGANVVETGTNAGFAAGCHAGVRASSAPLVLLLNPDCEPAPGCLDALRAVAGERPGWGAWQALVTLPGGERVNTAGNLVHYLGFGWAGRLDEPVASVPNDPHEVGFVSGAALAIRRSAWDEAGGFDERYFMYGEDLDLSLRLRLAGHGVGVAPAARVAHEYEFTKGDYKWFYLERNRWWTILAAYPGALLALLLPALLVFELVLLLASWRGGWLRAKLRAQAAVLRELPQILARRRAVQATRRVTARGFADTFVASLDSPHLAMGRAVPGAEPLQALYWRIARALLR